MKKIDVSNVTSTARQPLLGRSVSHLQNAYTEAINSLCKKFMPNYSAGDVVILEGLVDTGTAGVSYNISAGSVYYNGEVYQIPATGVLVIAANVAVLTLPTAYLTGDPVTLTDGSIKNVHTMGDGLISLAASGSGVKDYSAFKKISANPVFAKLTTVTTPAATTTFTLTGWDASPIDDDGIFTIANGRITPHLGKYKISCCIGITSSVLSAPGNFDLWIYKNGSSAAPSDDICGDYYATNGLQRNLQFNNYVINQTTATDYWTIVVYMPSGTYTITSVQLTVEPLTNTLLKAY